MEANMVDVSSDYKEERTCLYKGEKYSVRDNGAIMRHPKDGKTRKNDNIWSFGTTIDKNGYLNFCGAIVHIIVAYAFIGEPPTPQHIVDHIDTNKQNNRPTNLRWFTKLENAISNPITKTKIELLCKCPIEDVLKNPELLRQAAAALPQNLSWMRSVTKEEAEATLSSWLKWSEKKQQIIKETNYNTPVYTNQGKAYTIRDYYFDGPRLVSITDGYKCIPKLYTEANLLDYYNNCKIGKVFFVKITKNKIIEYTITDRYINPENSSMAIATKCNDDIKKYGITYVTIADNQFIHDYKSCFQSESVDKYMTIARGLEWTGGEVFDDNC